MENSAKLGNTFGDFGRKCKREQFPKGSVKQMETELMKNQSDWVLGVILVVSLLTGCARNVPSEKVVESKTPAAKVEAAQNAPKDREVLSVSALPVLNPSPTLSKQVYSRARAQDFAFEPGAVFNTESYERINENKFLRPLDQPISTFSIDVDTASYANVRRFLKGGNLPPKDAVRIEELINYFSYNYPLPTGEHPFSVSVDCAVSPWNKERALLRIGLKGKEVNLQNLGPANFVFLVDVSGSMNSAAKLPLVKDSLVQLVNSMSPKDRIAVVVYAGSAGLALPSTSVAEKQKILDAVGKMEAGGSTHGSQGIQQAYEVAAANFIKGGVNRVILCTDGDFNVGATSPGDLTRLIQEKARSGVFLTVLGFGMGNLKDSTMEKLADLGNGNYAYIDDLAEARKVLVEEANSTFVAIAKDVKIQIEFNPAQIAGYRLIGYENRLLNKEDFNDDQKDAGDIGAGHTVTALYEIIPAGNSVPGPRVDPLRYQNSQLVNNSSELATIKLRYKEPEGDTSKLMAYTIQDNVMDFQSALPEFKFATAVAGFGMLLRESDFREGVTWDNVRAIAAANLQEDKNGRRSEFLEMVDLASGLAAKLASRN